MSLKTDGDREIATDVIAKAPTGTRVEFFGTAGGATMRQRSLMWAQLSKLATRIAYHGRKLRPEDWCRLFLDELGDADATVPSLDGKRRVQLHSTSRLTAVQMGQIIDRIGQYAEQNGIKL